MATGSSTLVEVGSDGGLVLATLAGDQATFAALYDRFATRIHDFQLALLRDPYQAVEATFQTFQQAIADLNHLGEPTQLRQWLYTLAYRQAKQRGASRTKSRSAGTFSWASGAKPGNDPQAEIWRALPTELTQRDRALLTLHLRHGLDAAEFGPIVGMPTRRAQARLDELRPILEPVLRGRFGQFGAAKSTESLSPMGAVDRPETGTDHTTDDSPPPLRTAVPFVPPPAELRDEVLRQTPLISAHEGAPRPRSRAAWITTMVTVLVLIIGTVLFVQRSMERSPVIAIRFGPSSELALSTTVIDLGAANSTATFTLSNTGRSQLAWHATPAASWLKVSPAAGSLGGGKSQQLTIQADRSSLPEGDGRAQLKVTSTADHGEGAVAVALREERPPAIINPRASNTRIGGYGCPTTSDISATIRDESEPIRVVLVGPGKQTQVMQAKGDTYTGRVGSGSGTNIIWRIVATDARNNTVTSAAQVISHADCASRPTTTRSTPTDGDSSTTEPDSGSANGDTGDSSGSDTGGSDNGGSDSGGSGGSDNPFGGDGDGGSNPFGGF